MNATRRDPWKILGLPRGAPPAEIKDAYRRLAMRLHPDRNGGDPAKTERFKDVAWAYAVLSDPAHAEKLPDARAGMWNDVVDGLFGESAGALVDRIRKEGIGSGNIDSLIADFAGLAQGVHEKLPDRMDKVRERAANMQPSEILSIVETLLGKDPKGKRR